MERIKDQPRLHMAGITLPCTTLSTPRPQRKLGPINPVHPRTLRDGSQLSLG